MVEIEERKTECKIKINSMNGLVILDCEGKAFFNIKGNTAEYSINVMRETGYIETVRIEQVKEQLSKIEKEINERFEEIRKGIEELERLNLEIEIV